MKKIFLSVGALVAANLSGCAVVGSMVTTDNEYVQIAADNIGVKADTLKLNQETLHPSLDSVSYELKSQDGKRYKCRVNTGVRGSSDEALCKVRTSDGKWEYVGKSVELSKSMKEEQEDKPFITVGDSRYSSEAEHTRDARMFEKNNKNTAAPKDESVEKDNSYEGGTENTATPTLSSVQSSNLTPTQTQNGVFKVRDAQGHSYECHFANVGEVKSDSLSVCTKLY